MSPKGMAQLALQSTDDSQDMAAPHPERPQKLQLQVPQLSLVTTGAWTPRTSKHLAPSLTHPHAVAPMWSRLSPFQSPHHTA